jgi:trehalose synthase-fused probable maltokinase
VSAGTAAEWIATQRWFRSKHRPIAAVDEVDRAEIPTTTAALVVVAVTYRDGGEADHYLTVSIDGREPTDGQGAWSALAAATAANASLAGRRGRFGCASTDALATLLGGAAAGALDERRLGVEQSNTSVALGARLILKLYRLLEPGVNPDVEVSAFLTAVGFDASPALAGSVTYEAPGEEPAAAAMLQELVPSAGDGWAAMLLSLAEDPAEAISHAAVIGRVTGQLHAALRARPEDPMFPDRTATPEETAGWRASAERQLAQAVTAVSGRAHERLVELAPAITARFADSFGAVGGRTRVSRIHGDYHLGQLLRRTDGGFTVIDFEGEPARPLAERRAPASPLRDVAGMLRSLDYAARSAAERDPAFDADGWLDRASASFLDGYGGIPTDDAPLLAALELEKACYEVRYEAGNRPDWVWLPLGAIERLVGVS